MEIKDFIEKFADLFEDTDVTTLNAETVFRDLDEWSSLLALSTISMVDDEYDIQLTADEMRKANTIGDLFNTVSSKA